MTQEPEQLQTKFLLCVSDAERALRRIPVIVLYILLAIFIFGFLIFIHELGHFLVARACGVKILEFAIGMGPRILSHRSKKSGTVYALRVLPIGGFVSMLGESGMELAQGNEKGETVVEDPNNPLLNDIQPTDAESESVSPEDEKHAYCNQSVWKRILISLAGPAMNVLLGFLLMFIMVGSMGQHGYLGNTVIAGFPEGNISQNSGLMVGDEVLKIGKVSVHTLYQLNYEITSQGYRKVDVTVRRNGEKVVVKDVLFPTGVQSKTAFGQMDFQVYGENLTPAKLIKHSFWQSCSAVKMAYDSLFGLIGGRYSADSVSGPVGITGTIAQAAKSSALDVLHLVIVISINLGIMNLLPLPALDGGHILLYVVELIRGKKVKPQVEGIINFVGLIVLLALMAVVMAKDIITLF